MGCLPSNRNTGRADVVKMTSPSFSPAPTSGSRAGTPTSFFNADVASEICCGEPKRAVPRVTMSVDSTRSSAGTRIGEAIGAAVRAAISPGE